MEGKETGTLPFLLSVRGVGVAGRSRMGMSAWGSESCRAGTI